MSFQYQWGIAQQKDLVSWVVEEEASHKYSDSAMVVLQLQLWWLVEEVEVEDVYDMEVVFSFLDHSLVDDQFVLLRDGAVPCMDDDELFEDVFHHCQEGDVMEGVLDLSALR